jgi:hypothetical protein
MAEMGCGPDQARGIRDERLHPFPAAEGQKSPDLSPDLHPGPNCPKKITCFQAVRSQLLISSGAPFAYKTTNISVLDLSTCSGGLQDILAANNPDGFIVDFDGIEDRSDVALPGIDVGRVASFAGGVAKDEAAVRAAITLPWSNGQTEGQITVSSSSNVRCTAAAKSTFFRPD